MPKSLIVLGGGIIGAEYATMFAALGIDVTLMDRRDDLLRMLDAELNKLFMEYIADMGLTLKLGANIEELRKSDNGQAEVVLKDGDRLQADCLFF